MENTKEKSMQTPIALIGRADVEMMTSLSKTSIYNLIKSGAFPAPVRLLDNKVAWVQGEIQEWILSKIASRDQSNAPLI